MIIKLSSLLLQMLHLNKLCLGIITGVIAITGGGLIAAVTIGDICYRKHKKRKCKGMSELAIKSYIRLTMSMTCVFLDSLDQTDKHDPKR